MTTGKAKSKGTSRASAPRQSRSRSAAPAPAPAPAKAAAGATAKRAAGKATSRPVKQRNRSPGDWRAATLAEVRRLIHEADPDIVEERKWIKPTNPSGVPVWSRAGIVCTGETYKEVVKLTFAKGASLKDPRRLFNSSLEGNTRRAIDIREGESLDANAFRALIQAAVAMNLQSGARRPGRPTRPAAQAKSRATTVRPVKLLSGGNPQIAKADGDAPVQAYIDAMPGWKREIGQRLDQLIVQTVADVRKAVKWNSPFYGLDGRGWFVSFHVFTRYVKVTFFRGTSLRPVPPGGTGQEARWIDIHEDDFDESQLSRWIRQAASISGWVP